jgi:hypothetical protein
LNEQWFPCLPALHHYAIVWVTIIAVTAGVQLVTIVIDALGFDSNVLFDSFVETGVLSLTVGRFDPRGLCGYTGTTAFSTQSSLRKWFRWIVG